LVAPSIGPLSMVSSPPLPMILFARASVRPRARREPLGMPGCHLVPAEAPRPAAFTAAGTVHPRLAAQAEDILQRVDGEVGHRARRGLYQVPVDLTAVDAQIDLGIAALRLGRRRKPPDGG